MAAGVERRIPGLLRIVNHRRHSKA